MTSDPTDTPRCTATAKGTGERCKRRPIPGGTVCVKHGGGAPAVRAAAEQRQVEAAADALVAELWPGLAGMEPVKDPVDLLARTAAAIEHMADVMGARVNDLQGKVAGGRDLTQLRAEVVLLDRLLDKLLKAGDGMARLGIAERHVQLEQQRVAMVTAAFRAAVGVLQLVPADRDLVVRRFLTELGVEVPALEAGSAS
jgi:hypothetical protein